jgi:hypothetical protein
MNNNDDDNQWKYFQPNMKSVYSIKVFDDGNLNFNNYKNEWLIYGTWLGKSALINRENKTIKIDSISHWKLEKL